MAAAEPAAPSGSALAWPVAVDAAATYGAAALAPSTPASSALYDTRFAPAGLSVSPSRVDLVVYHADCVDGFGAAWAAWAALDGAERARVAFLPLQHGPGARLAPADVAGKHVVVLDFSFSADVTSRLIAAATGFLVVDHHASAASALKDVPREHAVFEMRQSGATLAWNFFHPDKPVPLFLRYVEDRDIWRWALADSRAFSAGFSAVERSFAAFDEFHARGDAAVRAAIERGRAVVEYQAGVRDSHVRRARPARLRAGPPAAAAAGAAGAARAPAPPPPGAPLGLAVNATTIASDVGNALCRARLPSGELAAFGLMWEHDLGVPGARGGAPGAPRGALRVSLRSDSDAIDVSVMARGWGGGGHRRAAGFTAPPGVGVEEIVEWAAAGDAGGGGDDAWAPEPAGDGGAPAPPAAT